MRGRVFSITAFIALILCVEALGKDQYFLQRKFYKSSPHLIEKKFYSGKSVAFQDLTTFPIARIKAAPGHLMVRKPRQIPGLTNHILETYGGNFTHDKILINLIKSTEGVVSVDLWNAHHRLVAYLNAGFHYLGEIPSRNIEVLVNGKNSSGHWYEHFVSIAGLDERKFEGRYRKVIPERDIRQGTVAVSGELSNEILGSINTIGELHKVLKEGKTPRIGVYFGTFDPIHEWHVKVARKAIEKKNLDELVFVPNWTPYHKPDASSPYHRLEMVKLRIRDEKKMNVYIDNSSLIIDQFGRTPFVERIGQAYVTYQLYQVLGEDSYNKLLNQGKISCAKGRKFIVIPRTNRDQSKISIPPNRDKLVTVLDPMPDGREVSSTAIRKKVRQGRRPHEKVLHPSVYSYIMEQKLYQ